MTKCQFYKNNIKHHASAETNSNQQTAYVTTKSPWCSHIYSPVTQTQAATVGGGSLLTCGGDEEKCQLFKS
jgi:hypothetical protein